MSNQDASFATLGQNIKNIRIARGVSQTKLAKATGMATKTISNLERGVVGKRFGVRQLFKLCAYLDCNESKLFLP